MLKKFFMAAIVGMIICAGVKAEAEDVYVGKSDATDFTCYIMTETIKCHWEGDTMVSTATLKMREGAGNGKLPTYYLDYTFYDYKGYGVDPRFENSQGYSGTAYPYETPIEWGMYEVIRKYY
jgi:hypothetical protein